MKTTSFALGLALMTAGVVIAFPAFMNWAHLIFSGGAFNRSNGGFSSQVEPTFIQFAIGALLVGAGQIFWKVASSDRTDNRYDQRKYDQSRNYHGDLQVGDTYQVNQAGAVGPNAHAHHMTFNQTADRIEGSINFVQLADELARLRQAMMREATEAEHSIAAGEVAKAEQSAKVKDPAKVAEHLRSAGKWALDIASKIGVPVAVEVLKKSIGIP